RTPTFNPLICKMLLRLVCRCRYLANCSPRIFAYASCFVLIVNCPLYNEPMAKFILVRHATNDTVGKRIAGRTEGVHLNEEGRQQSIQLAERLKGVSIAAIYSSPLERAIETAEPLAQRIKMEIQPHQGLLEIDFG